MERFYTSIHVPSESATFHRSLRITGYPVPHVDVAVAYSPASSSRGKIAADRAEGIIELAEL
jgi:hypothetical protein